MQLRSLELCSCLASLPACIPGLLSLTRLSLACNRLTGLPSGLGWLPQLAELDVSGNNLTSLPASLAQCPLLRTLNLAGNRELRTLPPGPYSSLTSFVLNRVAKLEAG